MHEWGDVGETGEVIEGAVSSNAKSLSETGEIRGDT